MSAEGKADPSELAASGPASEDDRSESLRQAARLAEDRIAEVVAAMSALKADNEAFRDRLEGQLSEEYERRRERLLLSSMQTLEAMDRAIEAARNSDAAESLISGVMLVRTQLFRILQEEGLERVSVLGLPFDRRSAEAVQRRPVSDPDQDGLVIEELQGGHQIRGHIVRRAKVVVGEFVDEAAVPPVIVKAMGEAKAPPPVPTVAMPALPETGAQKESKPPAEVTAPTEVREVEEPIVVEDWTEPTHPGTPATLLGLPAKLAAPPSPPAPPAPQAAAAPPPTPEEEDDSANATMVLGDAAAMFVRPHAPPTRGATAAATDPTEATEWESVEQWPRKGPKETQPVPRETRAAPPVAGPPSSGRGTGAGARPPVRPAMAGSAPPRLRTGPVPPLRDHSPVYEDVPTHPSAPAAPRPATKPGLAAARPPGGGRGIWIGLAVGAAALIAAVVIGWWVLGHRPKPPEAGGQVAEASPLAASPAAVAPTPVIPEDVTVVTPSMGAATAPALPSSGADGTLAPAPGTAGPQVPVPGLPTPAAANVAPPAANPPPLTAGPATARPTPPPPAAPVNPVPALLSQAEQALTAKRYDEAISRFNEVLKLQPQNPEAAAGKLHALGDRASIGRYFLTAVTMSEGKASSGGIKGFDGGSVVKSQCECALTYEVTPANPAQGDPYAVSIFLRNDSKKDIKPQSIAVAVTMNGSSSNRPVSLATKEIRRGQKTLVGRLEDIWKVGTTSWSMEGAISAGGNTYRAQLTWELRVPPGQ